MMGRIDYHYCFHLDVHFNAIELERRLWEESFNRYHPKKVTLRYVLCYRNVA